MAREVVLRLRGITKRFGSLVANDAVDLELARGEVLALLGENGAGKTTLMNILFGHYVAEEGEVEAFGRPLPPGSPRAALAAGIGMVHQHFTLADNLTALDNVLVGTEPLYTPRQGRAAAARRLLELADAFGLGVHPEARVRDLSVGERQRVEILKALYRNARVLILDEPTAVLTPPEAESLFETLRRMVDRGLSVLFISHKLREVMRVSDRVTVLRSGRVVAAFETAAASPEVLAEAMVGRPVPTPKRTPVPAGPPVLELDGVSALGAGGRALLEDVSLAVRAHEIVGIAGVSGNGQVPLADIISGLERPSGGSLRLFGRPVGRASARGMVKAGVGRIPEDRTRTGLIDEMAVWENLISETYWHPPFSRQGILRFTTIFDTARRLIAAFDIRCRGSREQVRQLSGGNMQKLILARVLSREPKFLLANQPTRGLDVGAIAYVHQQLLDARARGAGILLISEDLDEILTIADRVAVLHRGRLSAPEETEKVNLRELGLMMSGHKMAA